MSLPTVQLDDRDFTQLVEEAKRRIVQQCPAWTDLSPGDPGIMLVELFAYLTESMIYRLNKLPEKAFVEFLRLLGVKRYPPSAAHATLTFSLKVPVGHDIEIPSSTRVTVARSGGETEPPVFITVDRCSIKAGETEATVEAVNGEMVEGERIGVGTGNPGLSLCVARPPICHRALCHVGVEDPGVATDGRIRTITWNGKNYRIWNEVDTFAGLGADESAYVIDRMDGRLTFPPAIQKIEDDRLSPSPRALGRIVPKDREVRVWYIRGGGSGGNVAARMLTVIKDPIPGAQLTVVNMVPATGGADAERLENTLARGPLELRSLQRAVTADDFELVARESTGDVARAFAFAQFSIWRHAQRGTVELLLVPTLPDEGAEVGKATMANLTGRQTKEICTIVQKNIDSRRPIGTSCVIGWVKYKTVKVIADIVVYKGENKEAVKNRVLERLAMNINPLPTRLNTGGWAFGEPLRSSLVYDIILEEQGVRYVDSVRLRVDDVPSREIKALVHDQFQQNMWYAGNQSAVFRSGDDGSGWEIAGKFSGEEIIRVKVHPDYPGHVVIVTKINEAGSGTSRVHLSTDCGENWRMIAKTAFEIEDAAWSERDDTPMLLLATDVGLFELMVKEKAVPIQIVVNAQDQKMGFYAVVAAVDIRGTSYVAVAAQNNGGIYLSDQQGRTATFKKIGLDGKDVRLLVVQRSNERTFLWAGATAAGTEKGEGCFRWDMRGAAATAQEWAAFTKDWSGGTCCSLAFYKNTVFAGSYFGGMLSLDSSSSAAVWNRTALDCGLPTRDVERLFHPVKGLAVPPSEQPFMIMAAGPEGVYLSSDGNRFRKSSENEFVEKVTLPPTWLFCSGDHEVNVESEHEVTRN